MPPRVQIGLVLSSAILLIALFAMGVPDRLFAPARDRDADGDSSSGYRGYASDGYNQYVEKGSRAVTQGDYATAVEMFLKIPAGSDPRAVRSRMHAGEFLLTKLYNPTRGFEVLNELLAYFPEQVEARILLAEYLNACGRQFEADHQRLEVVHLNPNSRIELQQLAENPTGVGDAELLHTLIEHSPEDINVRLGKALLDLSAGNLGEAEAALRQIVSEDPRLWTAQAGLAMALIRQNKMSEYDAWKNQLPDEADKSSEIWYVRGTAAEMQKRADVAVRCFVEALRIDPDHLEACEGAAKALTEIGRSEDATRFVAHADRLKELRELVRRDPEMQDPEAMQRAAEITQELGRHWEARAWTLHLAASDLVSRRRAPPGNVPPALVEQMRFNKNPANQVDVSSLPAD